MKEFNRYDRECYIKPEIGAHPAKRWGDRGTLDIFGFKIFSRREAEEYLKAMKNLSNSRCFSVLEMRYKEGVVRLKYNRKREMIEAEFGSFVIDVHDATCDLSKYR